MRGDASANPLIPVDEKALMPSIVRPNSPMREYNTIRPHSALRYRRPAPEAVTRVLVGGLDMSFTLS